MQTALHSYLGAGRSVVDRQGDREPGPSTLSRFRVERRNILSDGWPQGDKKLRNLTPEDTNRFAFVPQC